MATIGFFSARTQRIAETEQNNPIRKKEISVLISNREHEIEPIAAPMPLIVGAAERTVP